MWHPGTIDHCLVEEQPAAGKVYYPLVDHLNTVRQVAEYNSTHDTTSIVKQITRNAYGLVLTDSAPSILILPGHTGKYEDPLTKDSYHWNRWYDLETGRWRSVDPISFQAGDVNLYRYVGNCSACYIDPVGLAYTSSPCLSLPGCTEKHRPPRALEGSTYSDDIERDLWWPPATFLIYQIRVKWYWVAESSFFTTGACGCPYHDSFMLSFGESETFEVGVIANLPPWLTKRVPALPDEWVEIQASRSWTKSEGIGLQVNVPHIEEKEGYYYVGFPAVMKVNISEVGFVRKHWEISSGVWTYTHGGPNRDVKTLFNEGPLGYFVCECECVPGLEDPGECNDSD